MPKAPRENRIPIMMSDTEVETIDSWRFDNRVATRSEAVRRLMQLGLSLAEVASAMETEARNRCRRALHLANRVAAIREDDDVSTDRLSDHLDLLIESELENLERTSLLASKVRIFSSGRKIEEALQESSEATQKMIGNLEQLRAQLATAKIERSKS